MREPFGSMTHETMMRILEEIHSNDIRVVTLSGWGEPLYHPKALWFIRELKKRGVRVLLNTNGTFLMRHIDEVINLVDVVVLSIEGIEPETYKMFRAAADLDTVIQCIRRINDKRRELKSSLPLVGVQLTLTKANVNQISKLADLVKKDGVGLIFISNVIPTSYQHEELSCYTDESCHELYSEQLDILGKNFVDSWNVFISRCYTKPQQAFYCPFIENDAMFVRWDGKVAPCLHYSHDWTFYMNGRKKNVKSAIFGDINNGSVVDIWREIRYVMFRFKVKFGYKPSCFDCDLSNWCSYTISNEADCYGNVPTCAHCPFARGLSTCPLLTLIPTSKIASQSSGIPS